MAGRIRTLKPEWRESESLASCSDAARVLSASLILLADDEGNGRGTISYLAAQTWMYSRDPRDTLAKAREALRELVEIGYVVVYQAGVGGAGQPRSTYFHLTGWRRHQRVDKPGKPRVPPPTDEQIREGLAKFPGDLAPDHDPDPDPDPDRGSVGAREGESEGKGGARAPARARKDAGSAKASQLPVAWSPTDAHRALATELDVSLERQVTAFRDHAAANGRRQVDWDAAFRTWLRRSAEYASRGNGSGRAAPRGGLTPQEIIALDLSEPGGEP